MICKKKSKNEINFGFSIYFSFLDIKIDFIYNIFLKIKE